MDLLELKSDIRTKVGNGPARALRREGKLPAVFYGPGKEPVLLSVATSDLEQVLKKSKIGQALFNLVVHNDGETFTRSAMIKELQIDPVSNNFLHVDFYEIAMDRKIAVKVPVVTKGKSKGIELGGILQIIRRELEVLCLPHEIPETIEIDVTDLDIGDSIHVKEILLEGDIEIPAEVNFTVLTIGSPKVEEIVSEEEEEVVEEVVEEAAAGEETSEESGAKD